jgi:hypothetical protein
MPMHISLSDIACSSRSVSVFGSRLEPVSCVSDWVVRVVGFDPRSGLTQPGPARSCAPLAPTPSHAPPPPLPLSFGSLAQQPPSPSSTSLSLWCPRDLRQRSTEFGPRGELPSPPLPFSSLSLPLSPSLPCAPPLSPLRAAAPAPAPPLRAAALAPCPSPTRRRSPAPAPASPTRRRSPAPAPASPTRRRSPAPAPAWPVLALGPAGPRRGLPGPRHGPGLGVAPAPGAQLPARGFGPLRVASQLSTRLAWPRLPPNAFPRA